MLTRRTFISSGIGLVATAGTTPAFAGLTGMRPGAASSLRTVVYDSRHEACNVFADAMRRLGVSGCRFDGDVTGIWSNVLHPLWAGGQASVGGMTTPGALFCLEQMARQFNHRITFRLDHLDPEDGDGTVHHAPWARSPIDHKQTGLSWPQSMAWLVYSQASTGKRLPSTPIVEAPTLSKNALISWVISAPTRS